MKNNYNVICLLKGLILHFIISQVNAKSKSGRDVYSDVSSQEVSMRIDKQMSVIQSKPLITKEKDSQVEPTWLPDISALSSEPTQYPHHKHRHKHKLWKAANTHNKILSDKHFQTNELNKNLSRETENLILDKSKGKNFGQAKVIPVTSTSFKWRSPVASDPSAVSQINVANTGSKESSSSHTDEVIPQINGESSLSTYNVILMTSQKTLSVDHVTNSYKSNRNGPNLPLFNHLHIPDFGMVDEKTYPGQPPIKGSHSIEGTFLWAVGLLGSVKNGAIFLTAVFSKGFRKPLHMLVATISGTDLFVCLIYIPTYTYFLLEGNRNFAEEVLPTDMEHDTLYENDSPFSFCNVCRAIFLEVASVTLTIKALIALYLYVLTCSKSWAKTLFSPRNTAFYIFLALLLNFIVLFLPYFIGYDKVDFYPNAFVCSPKKSYQENEEWMLSNNRTVYSTMILSLYLVELAVICICFIQVYRAILRGKIYSDRYRDKDSQAKISYTRALKIMVLVFTSFLICCSPVYIVNVIDPDNIKLSSDVYHLAMDLLLLKSCINPTIFVYSMRSLRYEMKLLCMCKCRAEDRHKYFVKPQVTSSVERATHSAETACKAAEQA